MTVSFQVRYFTSSCHHLQSLGDNNLVIGSCRFLLVQPWLWLVFHHGYGPHQHHSTKTLLPLFHFPPFSWLKPKSETGVHIIHHPHRGCFHPSPSRAVGEEACWFCMLGWRKALIGSLSTLPVHWAFPWHVTLLALKSICTVIPPVRNSWHLNSISETVDWFFCEMVYSRQRGVGSQELTALD